MQARGYKLEETKVSEQRLNTLILLIAIAYTSAIIQGGFIKRRSSKNTFVGLKSKRELPEYSTFYVGLHSRTWIDSVEQYAETVAELMRLNPNKRLYYQQGRQAVKLIQPAS